MSTPPAIRRPSRQEVAAAYGKTLPDLIRPGLKVLFCGINPSLYSAAVGHHFARPGNRFWPALAAAGFTDGVLHPSQQRALLKRGYGLTNLAGRATAQAAELSDDDLIAGGAELEARVRRYRPRFVAVLGVSAYRTAFDRKRATLGLQAETVGGAAVWVLPSPSGLNAHYQLADLARLYRELRETAG
jgi:TDG/mug DNA glycosylase family protein